MSTGDKELYIFEYPGKISGQTIIGFIETFDSIAIQISFKISFSENMIRSIKVELNKSHYKYSRTEDRNIYVIGLHLNGFRSEDFSKRKLNSDSFYKLLSIDFLDINNNERFRILQKKSKL
ncbi:hypothetical protein K1X84_10465 [bacterium]|nr:hypothetical protein [bacterium]